MRRSRIHQKLVALSLLLLLQGPALLVQEIGWASMLVRYSAESGLVRGTVQTFDGSRPCPFCKAAEKLRKQDEPARSKPKVREWNCDPLALVAEASPRHALPDPAAPGHRPRSSLRPEDWSEEPPSPPPRGA